MATNDLSKEIVNVLKFWLLCILGILPLTLAIEGNVSDFDMEIVNLLKSLNKPYVKSIKSLEGDIIDCVPINLQPAFDNPLLKNHTIQMQPSSYPKDFSGNFSSNEKPLTQQWQIKVMCPKGTIPIKRITVEDLLRFKSIKRLGKRFPQNIKNPNSPPADHAELDIHEMRQYAVRYISKGMFYGAKADIGVWNPRVEEHTFSLAQIWITANTNADDINSIEAGWQVYHDLNGDNWTHLFGFWTRDSYEKTGCYNMKCTGFVQTDRAVTLGSVLRFTSSHGGPEELITIFIFKDSQSGNWWLKVGNRKIGYWPANLFTNLRDYATFTQWGGEVAYKSNNGRHTATQMGSGAFSREGWNKAANFVRLRVVDQSNAAIIPRNLQTDVTNPKCYDLASKMDEHWGESFFFGGPGRNPRCH